MPCRFVFPLIALAFAAALYLLLRKPARPEGKTVVVYSSADTEFALPIFEAFTKETGIHVDYRFDGEETKVTALVKRLELMKGNPDGDIFWNSEQSCTLRLADEGVLQSYVSPNATTIPAEYKDAAGLWTGFGQRVRILLYNTDKVKRADVPKSLDELSNPRWKGRFAIAKPAVWNVAEPFCSADVSDWGREGVRVVSCLARQRHDCRAEQRRCSGAGVGGRCVHWNDR